MSVDICGYSALSEKDPETAVQLVRRLQIFIDGITDQHSGRRFHKAGDGFLLEFTSALNAVNAALAIQSRAKDETGADLRVGVHVGEVSEQSDGDLLGHGVNIAARLQAEADPGGILISSNLLNLLGTAFAGRTRRRGYMALKNISEPVEAFDLEPNISTMGRALRRAKRYLRQNGLAFILFGVAILGVVLTNLAISGGKSSEPALDNRINAILETSFADAGTSSSSMDVAYIRGTLRRLGESRVASDLASFALLEAGDISGALENLEVHLAELMPASADYRQTLHQIGALAYQHAPRKAIAAYENILIVDPDNLSAKIMLARTLSTLGEIERAILLFDEALQHNDLDPESALRIRLYRAYQIAILNRDEEADLLLAELEDEVLATNEPQIISSYHTERGLVLERLDRIDEAEAHLLAAAEIQRRLGYDHNLERVLNVLGFIAVKRAERSPEQRETYLDQAAEYFQREYDTAARINKMRGMAEALYFKGDVELRRQRLVEAEALFLQALRLSTEHGFPSYEFLAWVGMSEISAQLGDAQEACRRLSQAELIHATRGQAGIGPRTRAKIQALPCPFDFAD